MRSATRCFPWHHELYAFLDAKRRLRDDIADKYERQANQAAIEISRRGTASVRKQTTLKATFDLIGSLGDRFQISAQATARRVVEEN